MAHKLEAELTPMAVMLLLVLTLMAAMVVLVELVLRSELVTAISKLVTLVILPELVTDRLTLVVPSMSEIEMPGLGALTLVVPSTLVSSRATRAYIAAHLLGIEMK